jgi:hypothetical protein
VHLYDADGAYIAGLSHTRFPPIVGRLEIRGKKTPTSATLEATDGPNPGAFLRLHATQLPTEVYDREQQEWTTKYNAAKTPEKIEKSLRERPDHGVRVMLAAVRDLAQLSLEGIEGHSRVELTDAKGTSAVLGHVRLEQKDAGSVEERPASSLVLMGKNRLVLWKAP